MQAWRRATRTIGDLPGLRGLSDNDRARRLAFPLRMAPYVRESAAFAARELVRRKQTVPYTLRESGLKVHVRHPLIDLWVLYETFDLLAYALPDEARERLSGLGRPARILDLGGHVGLAAAYFLGELPGAHITAFEPDPANRSVLLRTVEANRGRAGSWEVLPVAAGARPGSASFVSDRHLSRFGASDHPDTETLTVEIADVFEHMDGVDLLKMDIEGGEWPILEDERFRSGPKATVVVLEYHNDGAPGDDGLAAASRLLEAAGYELGPLRHVHTDGGTLRGWRA